MLVWITRLLAEIWDILNTMKTKQRSTFLLKFHHVLLLGILRILLGQLGKEVAVTSSIGINHLLILKATLSKPRLFIPASISNRLLGVKLGVVDSRRRQQTSPSSLLTL